MKKLNLDVLEWNETYLGQALYRFATCSETKFLQNILLLKLLNPGCCNLLNYQKMHFQQYYTQSQLFNIKKVGKVMWKVMAA